MFNLSFCGSLCLCYTGSKSTLDIIYHFRCTTVIIIIVTVTIIDIVIIIIRLLSRWLLQLAASLIFPKMAFFSSSKFREVSLITLSGYVYVQPLQFGKLVSEK